MSLPALGFVEVRGLANAILVADAMVKGSSVRLRSQLRVDPALITIAVEGDVGACEAAVEAGKRVALANGAFVSALVKGRPDPSLRQLVPVNDPASMRPEPGPTRVARTKAVRAARAKK
jgi:microcompartment protein CcmL/EutN